MFTKQQQGSKDYRLYLRKIRNVGEQFYLFERDADLDSYRIAAVLFLFRSAVSNCHVEASGESWNDRLDSIRSIDRSVQISENANCFPFDYAYVCCCFNRKTYDLEKIF